MWGAIVGDIVGSRFEFHNYRKKDFELFTSESFFTDDTVLTVAVAKTLLKFDAIVDEGEFKRELVSAFHTYGRNYISSGFGGSFFQWVLGRKTEPYYSCGNGSAMRVSAAGWYGNTLEEVERVARLTAEITHNHPEGIKGAVVTAGCIFLARSGKSKEEIKKYIKSFDYRLITSVATYRATNEFDETCPKTIPVAMRCFLEGTSFEDVLRNAISVGGDSDTIAAIACSVAEAFYGIDDYFKRKARAILDDELLAVVEQFDKKYISNKS